MLDQDFASAWNDATPENRTYKYLPEGRHRYVVQGGEITENRACIHLYFPKYGLSETFSTSLTSKAAVFLRSVIEKMTGTTVALPKENVESALGGILSGLQGITGEATKKKNAAGYWNIYIDTSDGHTESGAPAPSTEPIDNEIPF